MEFAPSDRTRDLVDRLKAFMDERVYPAEAIYGEQLRPAISARGAYSTLVRPGPY